MYQSIYNEMISDTVESALGGERAAFDRSIELLMAAQQSGRGSRDAIEALLFTNRLWCILLDDLADPANSLPDSLKAGLISVGIWVLRRTEDIQLGKSDDFSALIDVSETIRKGLERR